MQSSDKTSVIDLNEDQLEENVSKHSSPDRQHHNATNNPHTPAIDKRQSLNSAG